MNVQPFIVRITVESCEKKRYYKSVWIVIL